MFDILLSQVKKSPCIVQVNGNILRHVHANDIRSDPGLTEKMWNYKKKF